MAQVKVGDRVIAIRNEDDHCVYVYGYGIYQGDEVPPDMPEHTLGHLVHDAGLTNPKIVLDNGKVVWGFECWWGSLANFEVNVKPKLKKEIKMVDIEEDRKSLLSKMETGPEEDDADFEDDEFEEDYWEDELEDDPKDDPDDI